VSSGRRRENGAIDPVNAKDLRADVLVSELSKFCNAVLVFIPDNLSSDPFTENSDGEHSRPNDAAGRRVDQQRPAAIGPKTINSKAPRQQAYHKRKEAGRPEQEGGETDPAQQMKWTLALLRYSTSRAKLAKSGGKVSPSPRMVGKG
jgi:hypothetical protein